MTGQINPTNVFVSILPGSYIYDLIPDLVKTKVVLHITLYFIVVLIFRDLFLVPGTRGTTTDMKSVERLNRPQEDFVTINFEV